MTPLANLSDPNLQTTSPESILFDTSTMVLPGVLSRRDFFLEALVLQDGTVAKADSINEIQRRIEAALQAFGSDIDYNLDTLIIILTSFTNAMRREQAAFRKEVQDKITAMEVSMNAALTKMRQDMAAGDAATLKAANEYTDAAVKEQAGKTKDAMIEASKTTVGVTTPELYDRGAMESTHTWPITVYTVPPGHTFYVHRWTFHSRESSGRNQWWGFYFALNWEGYAPHYENRNSGNYQAESGPFTPEGKPIATLPAGTKVQASVTVSGIKVICEFALEGYLVPDNLDTKGPV